MSKGLALLVGLKSVDPNAHDGWDGRRGCWGCELDVDNIEQILKPMGYWISALKTAEATSIKVLNGLRSAADNLQSGDIFVFYYSGHGGQQPDIDNDEFDGKDETLVLYDRQILDDELSNVWSRFQDGVRIVMISDSCNSGDNYRGIRDVLSSEARPISLTDDASAKNMKAQMIHYSGCREDQKALGYETGGVFTMAFCKALVHGAAENYRSLYDQIRAQFSERRAIEQQPQYSLYGSVSEAFETSRPFSIELTEIEVRAGLRAIPVSWLHQPSLAQKHSDKLEGARIGPLAAAAIGVAVGAAIQLTSQSLNRSISMRSRADVSNTYCDLSVGEIERLALENVNLIRSSGTELLQIVAGERESTSARALPVPVIAFLVGVATGAAAAGPQGDN